MTNKCLLSLFLWIIWLKLDPAVIMADFLTNSPNKHNIKPIILIKYNCFNSGNMFISIINSHHDKTAAKLYSLLWFNKYELIDSDLGLIIAVVKYSE